MQSDRNRALSSVYAFLIGAQKDPQALFRSGVGDDAVAVLRAGVDLQYASIMEIDLASCWALGQYHWLRASASSGRQREVDGRAMMTYLEPVYFSDPTSLPGPARQAFYYRLGTNDRPGSRTLPDGNRLEDMEPSDLIGMYLDAHDLYAKYLETHELHTLDEAYALLNATRDMTNRWTGPTFTAYAVMSDLLAFMLFDYHRRTGVAENLHAAVQAARDAVSSVATNHPNPGQFRTNLATILLSVLADEGQDHRAVVLEAVAHARKGVEQTVEHHPMRGMYLNMLSGCLRTAYTYTGQPELLEEAVQVGQKAVSALVPNEKSRESFKLNLANTLALAARRQDRR